MMMMIIIMIMMIMILFLKRFSIDILNSAEQ